jgi:NitT/TauT family transport system substrate-binding protein
MRRRTLLTGTAATAAAAANLLPSGGFAQAKTQTINMQLGWLASNNNIGEVVASQLGYFEEEKLNVVIQPGGPSIDGVAIVASGRCEIGQVSSSPSLMLAASQKIPVKCFATGLQQHPYTFFSLEKKPIRTPKDMVGKKIGIQATGKILLTALLKKHNIPEKDVEVVVIGSDFAPLLTGQTDAVTGWLTSTTAIKGLGQPPVTLRLWDAGVQLYALPLYATRDTLEKKAPMVAGFLKAMSKGYAFAQKEPEKAADLLVKAYPNFKRDDELEGLKVLLKFAFNANTKANGWGAFDPKVWQDQITLYDELKQFHRRRAQARRRHHDLDSRRHQGRAPENRMIRNARLPDGSRHDIEIKDGRIAALRPPTDSEPGVLLLPPLVDGHIHLDKTLLGLPWVPNQAAGNTVADRIAAERKVRSARTVSETETGANLVKQVVASGTLHMRSHVDIDTSSASRTSRPCWRSASASAISSASRSSPSRKAASPARPAPPRCSTRQSPKAPTWWAGSIRSASTATSTAISTRSSASPKARRRHRRPPARRRRRRHRPDAGDRRAHARDRAQGQGRDQPRLCAGLGADRPCGAHRRHARRRRHRHHESRAGRRHHPAIASPASAWRRGVRRLRQYPSARARLKDYGIRIGGPADFVCGRGRDLGRSRRRRPHRKWVMKAGRIVAGMVVVTAP